jgi:hypothetical protein
MNSVYLYKTNIEENHLYQPAHLQSAQTQYGELGWRLAFLRTEGAEPDPEPTREQIVQWYERNGGQDGGMPDQTITPNLWFEQRFPSQTEQFGPAFLEWKETGARYAKTTPISINQDFFASILSDSKLGLSIIYFEPEMQFYYIEPMLQLYKPTSQEKLQNLYRGFLIRSALGLGDDVNILNLFHEFRQDKVARGVTNRAKSVLAADASFFSAQSRHQRIRGIELHERLARSFVEQVLERVPGETLLLTDAYLQFCEFLRRRDMPVVNRQVFKQLVPPQIRDQYELGIRNDLHDLAGGGWHSGWKGIRLLEVEPAIQQK